MVLSTLEFFLMINWKKGGENLTDDLLCVKLQKGSSYVIIWYW